MHNKHELLQKVALVATVGIITVGLLGIKVPTIGDPCNAREQSEVGMCKSPYDPNKLHLYRCRCTLLRHMQWVADPNRPAYQEPTAKTTIFGKKVYEHRPAYKPLIPPGQLNVPQVFEDLEWYDP